MSAPSAAAPPATLRHRLALALGVAVSATCLWVLFRSLDAEQTLSALARADADWLVAAMSMQVAILLLRALRWRYLFRKAVRFADLFWSQAVGYLASNVLPLRLGDLVRFGWLFARKRAPASEIAFTIVFERFLDVLTLLVLGACGMAILGTRASNGDVLIVPAILAVAAGLFAVAMATALPRWRLYSRLPAALQRGIVEVAHCVKSMLSWRGAGLMLLTGLCAVASVAYAWLVMRSLAPDASWRDALIATAAVMVAMAIPAAPGSIGTFHLAASVALTATGGYPAETAVAISVVLHAIQYLGGSVIGLLGVGMWPARAFREAVLLARGQYASRSGG
jgi:uncharacterized protein (TIRG00374 family)